MVREHERRSLSVVTAKDLLQTPLTRRQVLIGTGLSAASLAGCTSSTETNPRTRVDYTQSYDLNDSRSPGASDDRLKDNPDRGIQGVLFSYDPKYAGGSIVTHISLTPNVVPQEFRFVSKEESPRPGFLVDIAYPNTGIDPSGTTFSKYPVTELQPEDQETIFLGVGAGPETYKDMRTYQIFPRVDGGTITGLRGRFTGLTTLQPPLQLRDK